MTEAQRESLCDLIRQAGAHAQALRDAGLQVDKKSRQDFVSQADLAVEQQIKGWLQAHFPQEGFLGEESGFAGDEQTVWVLDPVDGTTNFILGMDYWCISLARVCQGELTLGIIYAPDRDEFFFAGRGEGAYLNDQRLTLREPDPDAVVVGMGRSRRPGQRLRPGHRDPARRRPGISPLRRGGPDAGACRRRPAPCLL